MFLFKYLAHVLKLDFTPRNQVYEGIDYVFIVLRFLFILLSLGKFLELFVSFCAPETMNWSLLKESFLNLLLVHPTINGSETSIVIYL